MFAPKKDNPEYITYPLPQKKKEKEVNTEKKV